MLARRKENAYALWVGMQTGTATVGNSMGFLKKLIKEVPYIPAIPLLGIYPKKAETLIWNNICTPVFITALFTISKIWKQPKCSSIGEYIKKKKSCYIYTVEYYSVIKKKQIFLFAVTWMDLENIMLSKNSQLEKVKCHIISLM